MIVKFLRGLPASGKSTFAKEFCKNNQEWVRINRDDLRNMRGTYWIPTQEKMITEWEISILQSTIKSGYNVIMDATNLNEKHVNVLKQAAIVANSEVTFEYDDSFLKVSVNECIERDSKREASVGADVIMRMYNSYKDLINENIKVD